MLETLSHGIHVTCICPGGVKTPMYDTSVFKGFDEGARKKAKNMLLASAQEPEDTARSIVDAVKKKRFLVVTTSVAKTAYFLRRHFPGVWFLLMRTLAKRLASDFDKYKIS